MEGSINKRAFGLGQRCTQGHRMTSSTQLAEILRSFAKMGVKWHVDLSLDFKVDILKRLENLLQLRTGGQVITSTTLVPFFTRTTGVVWNDLSTNLQKIIEEKVHQFTLANDNLSSGGPLL